MVGEREHEEELAPLEVMNDVHALQDRACAHLAVTAARGDHHQLDDRGVLDRLGDWKLEVASEEADGFALHGLELLLIRGLVGMKFLSEEALADLVLALEVQAMPIDDRIAAQDEAHRLEIREGELLDALEALGGGAVGAHIGPRYLLSRGGCEDSLRSVKRP